MAELTRRHPLEQMATELIRHHDDSVTITADPFIAMVDVRLPPDPAHHPTLLGLALPSTPNTWVAAGPGRAIWLGPDEWLLTRTAGTSNDLEVEVGEAVRPLGGATTDVSAQRTAIRLTGRRARNVLAKGCSIDLHPEVFGRGRAAQTTVGLAGVTLLALSDVGEDFILLVRSSFAGYLAEWLLDAAEEFTHLTASRA